MDRGLIGQLMNDDGPGCIILERKLTCYCVTSSHGFPLSVRSGHDGYMNVVAPSIVDSIFWTNFRPEGTNWSFSCREYDCLA